MIATPTLGSKNAEEPAIAAMFEARKRVFVDLLKWDVPVLDDRYEVDQFDTPAATYLILTDEAGCHRASARVLPTRTPHILGDLFPDLCAREVPRGETIREITRFCIEPTLPRPERRVARNQLVSALADHALSRAIAAYTAVATAGWFRQIATFGWRCSAMGPVRCCDGEQLVALRIDIDDGTRAALAGSGIYVPTPCHTALGQETIQ